MTNPSLDLSQVFSAVQGVLVQNQGSLNQADTYNHDHGNNMVQAFDVITQAVQEKQGASQADQLEYASQLLRAKASSGSSKLYSEGLANAATKFQGKQVTANNAMDLITALMGSSMGSSQAAQAQQPAGTTEDPLAGMAGSLLSGLMGGQQETPQAQSDPLAGLAGSLLSGLMGGSEPAQTGESAGAQGGFDAGDLLQAGMSYMQAKQQGASSTQALIQAVMAASSMAGSSHREQSGALIANTLMQVIGSMGKK